MTADGDGVSDVIGVVGDRSGFRETDDEQHAAWSDQPREAAKRGLLVHVMENCHRGDDVESVLREIDVLELSDDVADVAAVVARFCNAGFVPVQPDY